MSPRLNLLDWRLRQQQRSGRRYQKSVAVLLAALLLGTLLLDAGLRLALRQQTQAHEQLQRRLQQLQTQLILQRREQQQREVWLQQLRQGYDWRAQAVATLHWFDELVRLQAASVHLQTLQFQDGELLLQGISDDGQAPLAYAQRLEASPWFTDAQLQQLQHETANATRYAIRVQTRTWAEAAADPRDAFAELMP